MLTPPVTDISSLSVDLGGSVAVVTGGASGIGLAIATLYASFGAQVAIVDRNQEAAAEAAAQIGRGAAAYSCDVTSSASVRETVQAVLAASGKVDILVNSAGRTLRTPTADVSEEDWEGVIGTNLTGTLRACQIFGRHMLERGSGRIINIASLSSFVALAEVAAYSASKAAVASLTKSLAVEWAQRGVNVNAIAPGVFRTSLNQHLLDETERGRELLLRTPMGRFGNVEEVAGAAVFLASDASSFVTGEIIAVDGGFLASGVNK